MVDYLNKNGIPAVIYYKKIFSNLNLYKDNNIDRNFPVSSKISNHIFSIPMHPYLNDNEVALITKYIIDFYKK